MDNKQGHSRVVLWPDNKQQRVALAATLRIIRQGSRPWPRLLTQRACAPTGGLWRLLLCWRAMKHAAHLPCRPSALLRLGKTLLLPVAALALAACTSAPPRPHVGVETVYIALPTPADTPLSAPVPASAPAPVPAKLAQGRYIQSGLASWYGATFHQRRTASGERFDMHAHTAAHKTLPFGTLVRVRNTRTGQSVVVRINDRGPFSKHRVIDLSAAAAKALNIHRAGVQHVELYRLDASALQDNTDMPTPDWPDAKD